MIAPVTPRRGENVGAWTSGASRDRIRASRAWCGVRPGLDSRAVERRIELDGCVNFRDLGGYPTADGRCAVLSTAIGETAQSLETFAPKDGNAWRELYSGFERI